MLCRGGPGSRAGRPVGSRGVLAHLRVPVADDDLEDKFINEQYKNWKARRLSRFLSASLLRPRRHARVLPTPCARDGLVALRCVLGR